MYMYISIKLSTVWLCDMCAVCGCVASHGGGVAALGARSWRSWRRPRHINVHININAQICAHMYV